MHCYRLHTVLNLCHSREHYLAFILRTFFVTMATVSSVIGLLESVLFFKGDSFLACFLVDSLYIDKIMIQNDFECFYLSPSTPRKARFPLGEFIRANAKFTKVIG